MISTIAFLASSLFLIQALPSSRIVDGEDAKEGQFPYIAQLKRNGFCYCGGSIIGNNTILTAAHCIDNMTLDDISVTVGSNNVNHGGTTYKIESVVVHEDYDSYRLRNDIALIKLAENIEFDEKIQPIELNTEDIYVYNETVSAGWGSIDGTHKNASDTLKFANVLVWPQEECEKYRNTKIDQDVCVVSDHGNVCFGDSGGPLVAEDKVIGVVSWGFVPCGVDKPSVFARVDYFIDWIEKNMFF